MLAYRKWYVARTNQIAALGYVSRTNQSAVFVLWFERCSNFNEEGFGERGSERAVRKLESSFRMRNAFLCFKRVFYRALREMRYYWTDKRYQITNSKRVAHAVKMMDSCTRENRVLCTVARSWLLFLHEESERKVKGKVLVSVCIFCQQNKHIPLKRW